MIKQADRSSAPGKSRAPVALVTGGARRIGASIVRELHAGGWNLAIHAQRSMDEALALAAELDAARPGSTHCLRANLLDAGAPEHLAEAAHAHWGHLDALVNNASTYYRTPVGAITAAQIDDLVGSNFHAPLLLAQACAAKMDEGAIVNILDVHARRPLRGFAAYCGAKAALWAATEALALELAPRIRVNGVAPGHMVWASDSQLDAAQQVLELSKVPMARLGGALEIARAVAFLLSPAAAYINGAILPVDGGLRLV